MDYRKTVIALLILIPFAVVVGWLASRSITPTTIEEVPEGRILEGSTLSADGVYHYVEETPYYSIEAEYPAQVPLTDLAAGTRASFTIEQDLVTKITEFRNRVESFLSPEEVQRLESFGRKYATNFSYEAFQSAEHHSYLYSIYEDTGGAHPNGYFRTYVFTAEGTLVSLDDLFAPGSGYLERLSTIVEREVLQQLRDKTGREEVQDSLFREGIEPVADNFQNFVLDGADIVIMIPPYQVAAYAAGSFEIRIPLRSLQDLLR